MPEGKLQYKSGLQSSGFPNRPEKNQKEIKNLAYRSDIFVEENLLIF